MSIWEVADISTYNAISNYTSFANAVDGVILRGGYRGYGSSGTMVKDNKLETHYAGLVGKTKIGYYWFTQAITEAEARAEADYIVNNVIGSKQNDFPIYWDTEASGSSSGSGRADGLSKAQRTACCVAFINRLKELGKRPGVYASESWYKYNLDFSQVVATGASIWVAKYSSYSPSTSTYDGWQYTSSASISGASGNVDKSHFYKDVAGWDGGGGGGGGGDDPGTIVTGQKIILDNTPLYATSTATISAGTRSGTYYIWSDEQVNARVRITNSPENVGVPGQITGWVNVSDINTSGDDPDPGIVPVTGVTISSKSETVSVGSTPVTFQLSATVLPTNATNKNVTWSTNNSNVATVDQTGLVTCNGPGYCEIRVTTEESLYYDTCIVTVNRAVSGVSLNTSGISIGVEETYQLVATVQPSDATNKNVTWSSSNPNIAFVNEYGIVSGINSGNCTITVTTEDQGKQANCSVEVNTHISSVELDKHEIKGEIGDQIQLTATIHPSNTTDDKTLTWETTNTDVATVDQTGLVTIHNIGSCSIIVRTVNDKSDECIASGIIYPTAIELSKTEISYILDESDPVKLNVTFIPINTTENDIIWKSTNTNLATVDEEGNITFLAPGSCYITATDVKGHEARCILKIYKRLEQPAAPTIIDDNIGKFDFVLIPTDGCEYSIDDGETWQKLPNFTNLNYNTTYTAYQRRYAHGYYLESPKSDPLEVKTKDIIHVEYIELDKHEVELIIEQGTIYNYQLNVTVYPVDADIKDINWKSSDEEVAIVDNKGKISFFKYGAVTITATSVEGEKEDSCTFTIFEKWETPTEPIIVELKSKSLILSTGDGIVYSTDGGETWFENNIIENLKPKTVYNFWQKKKASGFRLDSDISCKSSVLTPEYDIQPEKRIQITKLKLSNNYLYFDIERNTKANLKYTYEPDNATETGVYWCSDDDNICTIEASGSVKALNIGACRLYIKSVYDNSVIDSCRVEIYKYKLAPPIPTPKDIELHAIELNIVDGCEYSIDDGETWQDSPLFIGLLKNSYYSFCQRYKAISEYQPASEKSNSRVIKTLSDGEGGGTSPSGYDLGQLVEVNNINLFCSAYANKSDIKLTGDYYISNINECNNRIRITDTEDDVGVTGNTIGWVKISELQKVVDEIYVGDKIVVNGNINTNVDGSGYSISKQKAIMFVTNIFEGFEYPYEVSSVAGASKIGYAKTDDVRKYETYENEDE